MSKGDDLGAAAGRAREGARKATALVRDLRRLLGQAMAAEAEANRLAREAANAAASA